MSKLTVGTRLALGFALVILAGVIMAAVGTVQLIGIKSD